MKIHKGVYRWLRAKFTSYSFDGDYRSEQAIIERVFERYSSRMDGTPDRERYLWRSICQYRCQTFARKPWVGWLGNVLALLGLPVVILTLRRAPPEELRKTDCTYLKIDHHAAYQVPLHIRGATVEAATCPRYLRSADVAFALRLFLQNRAFYPELLLKFLRWIATVRPYLDRYQPRYLIQYCEYSAHSSLRKAYLNAQGIKMANVTHGEEFISCRSAFSSFDQYHAWELTPPRIHEAMRMERGEHFSFTPCADLPRAPGAGVGRVIGVLWPAMEGPDLALFVDQLNQLCDRFQVVVRHHPNPNYQNQFKSYRDRLRTTFSDPHVESIHSFIDRTGLVVGYMSAVLVQARLRGRRVLYLKDQQLASLTEYHDYYRQVPAIALEDLSRELSRDNTPREP
jgi:hypothetical protein